VEGHQAQNDYRKKNAEVFTQVKTIGAADRPEF
jgi:hypothetical protein